MREPAPYPDLIRLGGTPPLGEYVRELWNRREFALSNATGELRSQHLDTALGNVWHLLNPTLMIAVYFLVFGVILGTDRGVDNFIAFLAIGVFTYHWAVRAITGGAKAIVSNQGLIRSLQFPRALLPISIVLQETLAFLSSAVVMLAVVLITGEGLRVDWALAVPVFGLQFAFCLGGAFFTARAADRFRDTLNLLPFIFRLAFYASGVLYLVDGRFHNVFEANPWVEQAFLANPFYCLISLWRNALMTSVDIQHVDWMWTSATSWAAGLLALGLLYFRAGEKEYGRG
jgi:teichoic acid transport system permease protein